MHHTHAHTSNLAVELARPPRSSYRLSILGAVAAAALAVLSAVGTAPAGAGAEYKLTPPAGWVQIAPPTTIVLAAWGEPAPTGFRQNMNVVSEPFAGSLADYVAKNLSTLQRTAPDLQLGPQTEVTTCNDHPAHLLAWKSTVFGHKLVFLQVASVWFGRGYVLTYTRDDREAPIDEAVQSLASLCVRQT